MRQGPEERPVFVLAAPAHEIAGRDDEIQTGRVDPRDDLPLKDTDRIVAFSHHRKPERTLPRDLGLDSFNLPDKKSAGIRRRCVEIDAVSRDCQYDCKVCIEEERE